MSNSPLRPLLASAGRPLLILAPMQDVTDLPFWDLMRHYGGADLYYTEYFRVYPGSHPERHIVQAIDENPTGKPVLAQMIGQDIPDLVRTAKWLEQRNVLGIDLNLGCPAPVVCRKNAGGGLLRNPQQIRDLLQALRGEIGKAFTVKTRIGFDSPKEFDRLLEIFESVPIDALTVHGRTVREMYRTAVHYDAIAQAVRRVPAPVFANGNVLSVRLANFTLAETHAAGLMIGRGAIRNPWVFNQIRAAWAGEPPFQPTLRDVRHYIERLYERTTPPNLAERNAVSKLKKYLNFILQGLTPEDALLHTVRRVETVRDLFAACDQQLDSPAPFPIEPPAQALLCSRSERMTSPSLSTESPA